MKKRFLLISMSIFLAACQLFTSMGEKISDAGNISNSFDITQTENNQPENLKEPETKPTISPLNASEPSQPFAKITLKEWKGSLYESQGDLLPVTLEGTRNPPVVGELTQEQRNFLADQGFVVIYSGEEQFGDIREQVSKTYGQPYYLTTDAAFHALHLTFDELLRLLEKEVLLPEVTDITLALLDQVGFYRDKLKGTSLETDAELAEAYLAVAFQLFNQET